MISIAETGPAGSFGCHECDLFVDVPELAPGEHARCPRCRASLAAWPRDGLRRGLSYALAAVILLVLANLYPFLSFGASGLERQMTLLQSASQLYQQGHHLLAGLVLTFIVAVPGVLTVFLIALLMPLVFRLDMAGLRWLARSVYLLGPWSMVDVFLIGVLVSFTKIAALADVVLGLSFWAFVGFVVCLMAALSSLSPHLIWTAIEERDS